MALNDYHPNLRYLSPQQYWLLQHQITAFWHGFGISNGIYLRQHDVESGKGKDGEPWLRVTPKKMQKQLGEYLSWLDRYKAQWNDESTPTVVERYRHGFQSLLEREIDEPPRLAILKMISLLQENPWVEEKPRGREQKGLW
jgi:hypothetical protein